MGLTGTVCATSPAVVNPWYYLGVVAGRDPGVKNIHTARLAQPGLRSIGQRLDVRALWVEHRAVAVGDDAAHRAKRFLHIAKLEGHLPRGAAAEVQHV